MQQWRFLGSDSYFLEDVVADGYYKKEKRPIYKTAKNESLLGFWVGFLCGVYGPTLITAMSRVFCLFMLLMKIKI